MLWVLKRTVSMRLFILTPKTSMIKMTGKKKGAQWMSTRLESEGPQVGTSPAALPCVLEQDTLILA